MLGSAVICVVSVATIWAGTAHIVGEDFRRSREMAIHDTSNLARAFDEHMVRSLQGFDQTLLLARDAYLEQGIRFDLPRWVVESKFRTDVAFNMSIADRSGKVIATNFKSPSVNVGDREYFRFHMEHHRDDLHISRPLTGRVTGRTALMLTRRISDDSGYFAGAIILSVDPTYFMSFYQSVDLGERGLVQLVGTDGTVRARVAGRERSSGQSIDGSLLFGQVHERPIGSFVGRDSMDGVVRITSYRTIPGYALVVAVGLAVDEVFASAIHSRNTALFGATVLSILMFALAIASLRGLRRLNASEFKFRSMFDVAPVGIALVGGAGQIRLANRTFARLAGAAAAELKGRHVDEFIGAANGAQSRPWRDDAADAAAVRECEVRRSDGTSSTVLCGAAVASPADALTWLTLQDISERKRVENRLWDAAHTDALTRLPNRLDFSEKLDAMLAESGPPARRLALFLLDLDHFKVINDTLGHEAGDIVLEKAATRLLHLRALVEFVARPGGDEFAIVVRGFRSERHLMRIARAVLRTMRRRVAHRGQAIKISGSVGIAVAPRHGTTRTELMRCADLALYQAKRLGRNRAVMFEPALRADAERRYRAIGSFRQAVADNRLVPVYQPQIDLVSGAIVGFEALARIDAGDGRLLPPAAFADALEDAESCRLLGRSMIEKVVRDLAAWRDAGLDTRVAVNASSFDLAQESYAERLISLLVERRIPCEDFEVEITETSVLDDRAPATARNLGLLAANRVGVALDDFGTGYSSLTHLKCLPISRVKIDRTFIASITLDTECRSIVEAIVRLSHSLGKTVVAEGIENTDQLDDLREMGCDAGQGFLFARPMPAADVGTFLLRSLAERGAAANVFDIGIAAAAR